MLRRGIAEPVNGEHHRPPLAQAAWAHPASACWLVPPEQQVLRLPAVAYQAKQLAHAADTHCHAALVSEWPGIWPTFIRSCSAPPSCPSAEQSAGELPGHLDGAGLIALGQDGERDLVRAGVAVLFDPCGDHVDVSP